MYKGLFNEEEKISFSTFINYALYSSKGYYYKNSTISETGDFLTSPYISKIYAQTVAASLIYKVFRDYIFENNKFQSDDTEINLIELGANEGLMMLHLVDYFKSYWKSQIYDKIKIVIIEKNPNLHNKIYENFIEHRDKIIISTSLARTELISSSAVIFCNEFFDALCFDRCVFKNNKLYQINLRLEGDRIIETLDLADAEISEKLREYNLEFQDDYFFEFPVVEYEKYFEILKDKFSKIFFLINDYGDKSKFFHCTSDPFGTSRCFYKHSVNRNFYVNVFDQDITYDVNFSLLSLIARKYGLTEDGYCSQASFFLDNEWAYTPAFQELKNENANIRKVQNLIHPNGMGEKFKFISFKY